MPDFPRYESKSQIVPRQTSLQAVEDTTGEILGQGAKIGQQVQETALKWQNAVDTIQKTTSTANRKGAFLDITNRFQNDPNTNNLEQYFKEIDQVVSDNQKGFSSKLAESENLMEAKYDAQVAKIQMENVHKKKMIDVGQASTLKLLDLEANSHSPNMEGNIDSILNTQIQAGVLGHKDAYELKQKYVKQGKYNSFLSDMNSNPAETESKLSKNEYGFEVKELESAKKILETESKKMVAVNENELLTSYLNGEAIDQNYVKELMTQKKIDATFAESMINKLNDMKPDKLSQDVAYIELQDKALKIKDKGKNAPIEEVTQLMTDAMQAHSKGLLDKSDFQRVVDEYNSLIQEKLDPMAKKAMEGVRPKNLLETLSFWSDEYAQAGLNKDEIKARMYRKLIDGMTQGEDGQILVNKIIEDEINIQLADNLKKPDRQFAVNPDNKKRIYSDDGGATWVDEKTGKEVK